MRKLITEQKRSEMMKKRKYYSEHPKESRNAFIKKRADDFVPVAIEKKSK